MSEYTDGIKILMNLAQDLIQKHADDLKERSDNREFYHVGPLAQEIVDECKRLEYLYEIEERFLDVDLDAEDEGPEDPSGS